MKATILSLLLLAALSFNSPAQQSASPDRFGKTLNLGIGIGYYGYDGLGPTFHANYEIDVAKDFTLAPFVSFYTRRNGYYWDRGPGPDRRYYYYHRTVVPVGIKGTYYFDDLLNANAKWDFYIAGSLGFAIVNGRWDDGYPGDRYYYNYGNYYFFDGHVGAEYHFNRRIGAFLDLSSGMSTIGIAIH